MAYKWSRVSQSRLYTCVPEIIAVCDKVIETADCKVLYGHRTPQEQYRLYRAGKSLCDGYRKLSYHNHLPSKAVDLVLCPVLWPDAKDIFADEREARLERFNAFGGYVLGIAHGMGIPLSWGGDWDGDWNLIEHSFRDLAHFEVRGS